MEYEELPVKGQEAMVPQWQPCYGRPDYASLSVWKGDLGGHQQHKFHILFAGEPELSFSEVCRWLLESLSFTRSLWVALCSSCSSFSPLKGSSFCLHTSPLLPFSRTACQICHASVGFPFSFLTFVSICSSFLSVTHGLLEDMADV